MVKTPVPKTVYVDTSGWYALFIATDPRHEEAARIYKYLRNHKTDLVCTDWVLLETVSLLHRRAGTSSAQRFLAALADNPQVAVHWIDPEFGRGAIDRFQAGNGKFSLVDSASFECLEHLGLKEAFAFDSDFETQGYALLRAPD